MPRPKSILWVDDEIDGLEAHRRFLEAQGFAIAQAAHGDDALALLRRQPYSVVLLDEQMPGRRGLELLAEIRSIDPAMPIVMVTKSEDAGTLRGPPLSPLARQSRSRPAPAVRGRGGRIPRPGAQVQPPRAPPRDRLPATRSVDRA